MTASTEILFDALAEHAPHRLEEVGAIARTIVEFQGTTAADAKRVAGSIAASIAALHPASTLDLSKFSADELGVLRRARSIMDGFGDSESAQASGARDRLLGMLEDIARRQEELSNDELLFVAAKASRAELTAHILVLDRKIAKQREEITALSELNETLEARLALEATQ
jgi:hypothetical protein